VTVHNSDLEVITTASSWLQAGHRVHLVTVAKTWGSSPRPEGSLAAVRADGVLVGSVSGGCVEKQLSERFLKQGTEEATGSQTVLHHINDEQAQRFGLSCGGELELTFELFDQPDDLSPLLERLEKRERVTRTLTIENASHTLAAATPQDRFSFDGKQLTKVFGPDWRLLIIGAGQLSRFSAEFALALDYEVIVCEPRPGFAEAWNVDGTTLVDHSPDDAVLEFGADARCAVLALTHDPNIDDLALIEALPAASFYVGALGSRANYEKRKKRLLAVGLEAHEIERLHGPIGLDIGSRTSAEIAVSIVAHLIQVRRELTVALNAPN